MSASGNQTPGVGHNSGVDNATASRLTSYITRVERLEEERTNLGEDIKEVFGEAKANGFDVKTMRRIIQLRKLDLDKRREAQMLLETYAAAVGMPDFSDTPLGQAASNNE